MLCCRDLDREELSDNLVEFIKNHFQKSGFQKAVLGLSGGIDSAVVAVLASKAIGPENVTGILMPYRTSSPSSIEDAMKIVKMTGMNHKIVEITGAVNSIESFNMDEGDRIKAVRLGNVMARVRMITLFDFSSANDALVLGTGNKSEIYLGYFTLFGDSASAINPIGDIYKTEVFKLAEYLHIPQEIISKPPSADLMEGQTDESEIGFRYADMDRVIHGVVDLGLSPEQIIKRGEDEHLVNSIHKRINDMEYKRKTPVIAKLSPL
jgi:NAD+ synthase